MTIYLLVAVGGALGAVARLSVATAMRRLSGGAVEFPWGTLAVNITGSFALGLLIGLLMTRDFAHPDVLRYCLGVGFLGAYTTFSTFELEGSDLFSLGQVGLALLYMVGSVLAGFAAVRLGLVLGRG